MSQTQTKIIVSELEILDLFHNLRDEMTPFLIWKKSADKAESRLKILTSMDQSNLVDKEVRFIIKNKDSDIEDFLHRADEIFAFTAQGNILFKGKVKSLSKIDIIIHFPTRINVLGDQELKVMMPKDDSLTESSGKVVEKDTDEIQETTKTVSMEPSNEDASPSSEAQSTSSSDQPQSQEDYEKMRTAPRGKSKGDQVVEVKILNGPREGEVLYFEIYDISTGGMGVLASSTKDLSQGERLEILNISGRPQKTKLTGEVVSLDEVENDDYPIKFGVKFDAA